MNTTDFDVRRVCRTWELLRLPYNLVLLGLGLLVFLLGREGIAGITVAGYWGSVLLFGLAANLAYCFGPLAEVCAYALFRWRMERFRYGLFAGGLIFSMAVVFSMAVLCAMGLPGRVRHRQFVGAKPKVADVVGTYVLSDQTVIPGGVSALGGRQCVLDVRADGSFSITNYPECAGARSSKLTQYTTFYDDTGTWQLATVGISYGYTQNRKDCWGLGLHGSKHTGKIGSPAFMGPGPPYELRVILGDPDSNNTLRFKRKE